MGAWVWESRVCRTRTPTLTLESCLESRIGVLGVRVRVRSTHTQRKGRFSAISDGRSPGKTPSIGGDSRGKDKSHSHEGAHKHTKRDLGWHPFLWFFVPFCGHSPLPVIRTVFNVFFPRISAKRSECCRPSVVADRSTFPPRLLQLHPRTGGRRFFSN